MLVRVAALHENSKRTRVEPIFRWLRDNGGDNWPARFLDLADGIQVEGPGRLVSVAFEKERRIPPSPDRLAWMIENAERLAPLHGRRWREYRRRVMENPRRDEALAKLRSGVTQGIDRRLKLEGSTSSDCLIECDQTVIWVEGKRNDWLAYSTSWDVTRDQLARNAEAAWLLAEAANKASVLVICHEQGLKHHEEALLHGYRNGTWSAGWPHLSEDVRAKLGSSIGTLMWKTIMDAWPRMANDLT
jgi:hypothetical protein